MSKDVHMVGEPLRANDVSEAYFHGLAQPDTEAPKPTENDLRDLERASISSVLIAKTIDKLVQADDSPLRFGFVQEPPKGVTTTWSAITWVEDMSHAAMDELITTDESARRLADRYEDLVMPGMRLGRKTQAKTRRETISFGQLVSEPDAWLKMAAIAGQYRGFQLPADKAFAFTVEKMKVMRESAHERGALQFVRGAVLEAAIAFGGMRGKTDADTEARYAELVAFVREMTDPSHELQAKSFGDLHDVALHPEQGLTIEERPNGFGPVRSNRRGPLICPAAYRFTNSPEAVTKGQSALFRGLSAGVMLMQNQRLFTDSLRMTRLDTAQARRTLAAKVQEKNNVPASSLLYKL